MLIYIFIFFFFNVFFFCCIYFINFFSFFILINMNFKIKSFPFVIRVDYYKGLNKNESQKKEFFIDFNNKNINKVRIKKFE